MPLAFSKLTKAQHRRRLSTLDPTLITTGHQQWVMRNSVCCVVSVYCVHSTYIQYTRLTVSEWSLVCDAFMFWIYIITSSFPAACLRLKRGAIWTKRAFYPALIAQRSSKCDFSGHKCMLICFLGRWYSRAQNKNARWCVSRSYQKYIRAQNTGGMAVYCVYCHAHLLNIS